MLYLLSDLTSLAKPIDRLNELLISFIKPIFILALLAIIGIAVYHLVKRFLFNR